MLNEHIQFESTRAIARVRFNRPEKRNAITESMYDKLREAVEKSEADPAVRVLVIASTSDNFTAGNDLQDFMHSPPSGSKSSVARFLRALSLAKKPLVAAVDGIAIGIGTTLLLHCDFVVASRTAKFQLPFVNLGLAPEAASSLLLPRLVGHVRAAELLLLGDPFDAEAALAYGIVNRVVGPAELESTACDFAVRLASKAPGAVQQTKALMKSSTTNIAGRMAEEELILAQRFASPEAREAFQAFFERRTPDFRRSA